MHPVSRGGGHPSPSPPLVPRELDAQAPDAGRPTGRQGLRESEVVANLASGVTQLERVTTATTTAGAGRCDTGNPNFLVLPGWYLRHFQDVHQNVQLTRLIS